MNSSHQRQAGGDNSINVQGKEVQIINQGLTLDQMDEIKSHLDKKVMEVFRDNFIQLQDKSAEVALERAHDLLDLFLERLSKEGPERLSAMNDVGMQQALYNAQKSAALAGDDELSKTLVDILIDKTGVEPRSLQGVIFSEAVEVAGKLTTEQINLLTALLMLRMTIFHGHNTRQAIIDKLTLECTPLFNNIPTTSGSLQYMSYTGVGTLQPLMDGSIYDGIRTTYDAVFTDGFLEGEVPDSLRAHSDLFIPLEHIQGIDNAEDFAHPRIRFVFNSSQHLDSQGIDSRVITEYEEQILALIKSHMASVDNAEKLIRERSQSLAAFIDSLQRRSASSFILSAVGVAIGHANWRRLRPSSVPEIAIYLA